jgi:hypothetical protein
LILVADALHDMPDPASVLAAARTALAKGGVIAIAEAPYPSEFSGQADPAERLGYLTSLFNCLHIKLSTVALAPSVSSCERATSELGCIRRAPILHRL